MPGAAKVIAGLKSKMLGYMDKKIKDFHTRRRRRCSYTCSSCPCFALSGLNTAKAELKKYSDLRKTVNWAFTAQGQPLPANAFNIVDQMAISKWDVYDFHHTDKLKFLEFEARMFTNRAADASVRGAVAALRFDIGNEDIMKGTPATAPCLPLKCPGTAPTTKCDWACVNSNGFERRRGSYVVQREAKYPSGEAATRRRGIAGNCRRRVCHRRRRLPTSVVEFPFWKGCANMEQNKWMSFATSTRT